MNKSKYVIFILSFIFSVFLYGCGKDDSESSNNNVITKSAQIDLNKARFTEASLQVSVLKQQIYLCAEEVGYDLDVVLDKCNSGANGITYHIPDVFSTTYFESFKVKGGSIIATAKHQDTLKGETLILDPVISGSNINFVLADDSTCIQAGYC